QFFLNINNKKMYFKRNCRDDLKTKISFIHYIFIAIISVINIQIAAGTGRFELQVVEIQNHLSQVRSGTCCNGDPLIKDKNDARCPESCNTVVALCLKPFQTATTATVRKRVSTTLPRI
ncbi:hypothetical protein Anas_04047, partial [Armadillidium nasatum]